MTEETTGGRTTLHRRRVAALAVALSVVGSAAAGCTQWRALSHGTLHPITPEQSRAQVIDAARDLVHALRLPVLAAYFSRSPCADEGAGPYQGKVVITYPKAPSFTQSDADVAAMVATLQTLGWTIDSGAHTHATALTKNNVKVLFSPQNNGTPNNGIDVTGPCLDVTTDKSSAGHTEVLTLP